MKNRWNRWSAAGLCARLAVRRTHALEDGTAKAIGEVGTQPGDSCPDVRLLTGLRAQKGIITYGIAPNRQNAFAGAAHDAVFNTWRRFSAQMLYWAPAAITGYYVLEWATHRYVVSWALRDRVDVCQTY
jgi:hypothetical protein